MSVSSFIFYLSDRELELVLAISVLLVIGLFSFPKCNINYQWQVATQLYR